MKNILQLIGDPKVFAPFFKGDSWLAWKAFLATLFALPMTDEQLELYRRHTGRTTPPTSPFSEAWLVIGRRGGKSFVLATIAVFLACFRDWRPYLGPGEVGTIMIVARDRRQARVIKRYCNGLLRNVEMLKQTIKDESVEVIELRNSINIEIHTASFRSVRGYTIIAALLDEIAFWDTDELSAEPDFEIVNAVKPGMSMIPEAVLLCASSPHSRKGAMWDAYRRHYGKDGDDVLVWQAATREMNSKVPQSYIDKHIAEDPAKAAAEYGGVFRTDVEQFLQRERIEACVIKDRFEVPWQKGCSYFAFCDPAGGGRGDLMTLAIDHIRYGEQLAVLDALREVKPPFSPEAVVGEFSRLLKSYQITTVVGDRYAGEWPKEQFAHFGIIYVPAEKAKSQLYVDLLSVINSNRIELLDDARLISQLCGLERTTVRGRGESVDHARDQHDDVANVLAGVVSISLLKYGAYDMSLSWVEGPDQKDDIDGARAFRQERIARYLMSGGTDQVGGFVQPALGGGRGVFQQRGRQTDWR